METQPVQGVDVRAERERYVPRGIATTDFVVSRAEGASVWDADGTSSSTSRAASPARTSATARRRSSRAIHEQVDHYLHQCFMVAHVRAVRRGLPPARRPLAVPRVRDEVAARQLRRRGGRERGQDRARLHRPARGDRVRPRVPRPHEPDDGDDGKVATSRLRPARARGLPRARAVPVPRRHDRGRARRARAALQAGRRPRSRRRLHGARDRAGRGRVHPDAGRLRAGLKEICEKHGILYVDDEVQSGCGRTGPVWAIEHLGVEPDLIVSGKSLGGGLPLAASPARPRSWTRRIRAGSAEPSAATRVAAAAACAVLDVLASPEFRERADEIGRLVRARLDGSRPTTRRSARSAASARCSRSSSRHPRATRRRS